MIERGRRLHSPSGVGAGDVLVQYFLIARSKLTRLGQPRLCVVQTHFAMHLATWVSGHRVHETQVLQADKHDGHDCTMSLYTLEIGAMTSVCQSHQQSRFPTPPSLSLGGRFDVLSPKQGRKPVLVAISRNSKMSFNSSDRWLKRLAQACLFVFNHLRKSCFHLREDLPGASEGRLPPQLLLKAAVIVGLWNDCRCFSAFGSPRQLS